MHNVVGLATPSWTGQKLGGRRVVLQDEGLHLIELCAETGAPYAGQRDETREGFQTGPGRGRRRGLGGHGAAGSGGVMEWWSGGVVE